MKQWFWHWGRWWLSGIVTVPYLNLGFHWSWTPRQFWLSLSFVFFDITIQRFSREGLRAVSAPTSNSAQARP